jgi:amidase
VTDDTGIWWLPVREQAALVRAGTLSARELVSLYLERIEALNPALNALVTVDPERALREAALADQAQVRGEPLGPLHGLPVAFKDTHDTAGMRTTYGSPLFADHVPDADDPVVARMRQAGAITVGKTNVPEFAAGGHSFNQIFGVTRNPYDLRRTAGGSTGGTAAALAAGLMAAGEGSDLGGSLRTPASFCNVVGLRPSPGQVPGAAGSFAWDPLGVSGPMGRTVDDTALVLSVISQPDPRTPLAPERDGGRFGRPRPADLRGLRVAWAPELAGQVPVDPDVLAALTPVRATLEGLGCAVEADCPDFGGARDAFRTLRSWMFAFSMGEDLRDHRDQLKPSLIWNIEQGQPLTGQDVAAAMASQAALFDRAREFFTRYDVLALPAAPVTPFPVELEYPAAVAGRPSRDYLDWLTLAACVTMTGCPAVSVPAAFTPGGLPVGLQLVGPYRGEERLLPVALAVEEATQAGRVRPDVLGQPPSIWSGGHHVTVRPPAAAGQPDEGR